FWTLPRFGGCDPPSPRFPWDAIGGRLRSSVRLLRTRSRPSDRSQRPEGRVGFLLIRSLLSTIRAGTFEFDVAPSVKALSTRPFDNTAGATAGQVASARTATARSLVADPGARSGAVGGGDVAVVRYAGRPGTPL